MCIRALLPLLFLLQVGCDAFTVKPFAGAVIELEIFGATASAPGEHLELWARNQFDDVLRLPILYAGKAGPSRHGLQVRLAVDPRDPCLIDRGGHLLTSSDAYPRSITVAGVIQTPDEQAQQVRNRLAQLNGPPLGRQASSLLAVVPYYDDRLRPRPDADADPRVPAAQRLADCTAYWNASPFSFTGNPAQVTAPLHSIAYGFIGYTTVDPPTSISGIRLDTPVHLKGLRELWLTQESAPLEAVDPQHRGPVFLVGSVDGGGRRVLHLTLTSPLPGVSGSAAVLADLDESGL